MGSHKEKWNGIPKNPKKNSTHLALPNEMKKREKMKSLHLYDIKVIKWKLPNPIFPKPYK
jgi:hypothetical protein